MYALLLPLLIAHPISYFVVAPTLRVVCTIAVVRLMVLGVVPALGGPAATSIPSGTPIPGPAAVSLGRGRHSGCYLPHAHKGQGTPCCWAWARCNDWVKWRSQLRFQDWYQTHRKCASSFEPMANV